MQVSTDTKTLYLKFNDIECKYLFDRIIKRYNNTNHVRWHYFVSDKRHGVFLWFIPKFPTLKFTCMLQFHGYSNDSPLLTEIFKLFPLNRWLIKRLDITFDSSSPYHQFHAVHPPKRADVRPLSGSIYMGSKRSSVQLHLYDKQAQMLNRRGVRTDTWTRAELRFRLPKMKRVSELTLDDFAAAAQYQLITDVGAMPDKLRSIVQQLNLGLIKWSEVKRATQKKIRQYAAAQAINLHTHLLSNVEDIQSFIYTPFPRADVRTS